MIYMDRQKGRVMEGILYLCATPIGNLEDITLRVLRILKEVDLIAAEDTRNSIKLLNHFDIKTPMTSYHEYNKIEKADYLINILKQGKDIALVTDAGTPGISDPGEELVRKCIESGIRVTSVPGPAACITALIMSGLSARRFAFEAFLPRNKKERKQIFDELKKETRTIVMYEAPHHLQDTLKEISLELGNRKMSLCKELTKKHEHVEQMSVDEFIDKFEKESPRGEYVLVIEGLSLEQIEQERREGWKEISINDHMDKYISEGLSRKEAMKAVAKDRGISKRDVYKYCLGRDV